MLTREENELLTQVGPGTPGGELLRRYWYPVGVARELTDQQSTKHVRILGEDLVLFKDRSGNFGLLQDHCAHRGASLLYGRVEERGIACAYHGWLFDTRGDCLECPAEPVGSLFHLTVKMRAYPVRTFVGLCWAYLGPLPAPAIPRYDVWARPDGGHIVEVYPRLDANWLQAMENSADPAHAQILHGNSALRWEQNTRRGTPRGTIDDVEEYEFYEVPYGLMKKRTYHGGMVDAHPIIFPNILRHAMETQIRVPVDDTHTDIYFVYFRPSPNGDTPVDEEPEVTHLEPFKSPAEALHPYTRIRMDKILAQDHMAWETQGPLADRGVERLATSDRGVVFFRDMLRREIERVRGGQDPMAVVRDPNHAVIDTNLDEALEHYRRRGRTPAAYRGG